MIKHVCGGHEWVYNPATGQVTNNYGTVRAVLLFHKFTPAQCPYIASLYPANADGTAETRSGRVFAILRATSNPSDARLAEFAIGHTAANHDADGIDHLTE